MIQMNQNNKGFSLIEMMVVVAIASIVGLGVISMTEYLNKERARANFLMSIQQVRQQLYGLVEDKDSWAKIYENADNTIFNCIKNGPNCATDTSGFVKVVDQAGVVVYDPSTEGYTFGGKKCLLAAGADMCPVQFEIKSNLMCATATCIEPSVKTLGKVVIRSNSNNFPINTESYGFESYRKAGSAAGGSIVIVTTQDVLDEAIQRDLKTYAGELLGKNGEFLNKLKVKDGYKLYGVSSTGESELCTLSVSSGHCGWNASVEKSVVTRNMDNTYGTYTYTCKGQMNARISIEGSHTNGSLRAYSGSVQIGGYSCPDFYPQTGQWIR